MAEKKKAPRSARLKHDKFVEEYLIDFNGRQAAIRAGYSVKSATCIASQLLRRPEVAEKIAKGIAERRKHAIITADRVLKEYARIAFADVRRVSRFGPEGVKLRLDSSLTDDDAAAIAEVSQTGTGRSTRIKLHDKRRALDSIARHLGLFQQQLPALDPKRRHEAAARARETLMRRLAGPETGEDAGEA